MMIDVSMLTANPFYELASLLFLAAAVGLLGTFLRQPLVVSFIAVGLIAGPSMLGIAQSHEHIKLLAELGIAVLLFIVGLKLDLKLIKKLGSVALITGLGQIIFTAGIGFAICIAMGIDTITSLHIAVALTFSSTIIIVKLLSDKREADSLHGRIAIGVLIVQDIVVVLAMMALAYFGMGEQVNGHSGARHMLQVIGYATVLLAVIWVFIRYLASPLMGRVAQSSELMVTFAIAWAALLAAICHHIGFGKELGGLLAGVSLASTPFREAIISRLVSLRDFLLLFFFIALGSQIDIHAIGSNVLPAVGLSLFVLIGKPLVIMMITGVMGYRKRTGFLAGLTAAQISEFSLIYMTMCLGLGYVDADAFGLVTLVGLITIALSVYLITYSHAIYRFLEPILGIFERSSAFREDMEDKKFGERRQYDAIVIGMGRYGSAIATTLKETGYKVLVIDFNPDLVRRWRQKGYRSMYGDACDAEFIASLPLHRVGWVISAMPQHDVGITHEDPRLVLIDTIKQQNFKGHLVISTQDKTEKEMLIERGASVVFMPYQDASRRAVNHIKQVDKRAEKAAERLATKRSEGKKKSKK